MVLTRRQFALLAAAPVVAAGGFRRAFAQVAAAAEAETAARVFEWKAVGDVCHVAFGQGGNALVVASRSEALLVDAKLSGLGVPLRRESESRGGRLVRLLNTHHHADHTGGNSAFTPDLPVLAHEKCRPRVAAQLERYVNELRAAVARFANDQDAGARVAASAVKEAIDHVGDLKASSFEPTELMQAERSLKVGDVEVQLRHAGAGHTDNDVFVFLPAQNVLHTGDLLFHRLHAFYDASGGANSVGWQRSIDAMLALCDERTIVVPGHGEITDKAGLQAQRDYFDTMRAHVQKLRANGVTREVVVKEKPDDFQGYGFEQALPRVLGGLYDELGA